MQALIGALERDWTRAADQLAHFTQFDHAQSALRVAAIRGRAEAMQFLLREPGTNPAFGSNVAIRESLENGHVDIARMLLQDHRVHLEREPKSACILLCAAVRCPKVKNDDNEEQKTCLILSFSTGCVPLH